MKFPLSWLKQYLDTDASIEKISETLTATGTEVEEIVDRASIYAPFKVVEVLEAVQHPNADRLRVCQVRTEKGDIQVVCGAPNARTGMKAFYAPEGSTVPSNGLVLKKTKIRDVESNGMLVSMAEMGLSEESNGIIDADLSLAIGTPLAEVFNLNDPVIDISLTPNRPDCAGIYGIARDLAAAGLGKLKTLETPQVKANGAPSRKVNLAFEAGNNACPYFLGRVIRNVKNGESPEWLQTYLKAAGQKPISALVDITNYFSLGLARPLHVFDLAKIKGDLTVRAAKTGEELLALNGKTYELQDGQTVVCDEDGVVALGGIMGGEESGCTETTTDVYLECAWFDPARTARTGRDTGIVSDARYRFERGVDAGFMPQAMEMATQLLIELCGGEAEEVFVAGKQPDLTKTVSYDPAATLKLTGVDVSETEQLQILADLGFTTDSNKKPWSLRTPSWRPDLEISADIVEEIIRIAGFDRIPAVSVTKNSAITNSTETVRSSRARMVRSMLAASGLQEAVTWSFLSSETANKFKSMPASGLVLTNPISNDLNTMRPSIIPNLVLAAKRNKDRGFEGASLFEIGPVFKGTEPSQQPWTVSGLRSGQTSPRTWHKDTASCDYDLMDAKNDVLNVLDICGIVPERVSFTRTAPAWMHPGRSGEVKLGNQAIGVFGELHPAVLDSLDIDFPCAVFEINLDAVPENKKRADSSFPAISLSDFQPISRDFAFVVDETLEADTLVRAIKGADRNLITETTIFDVYQGEHMAKGKKSIAVSVTLQPTTHTLTDVEIETVSKKIVEMATSKAGATLRS